MSKVRRRFQFRMSSLLALLTLSCIGVGVYRIWNPPFRGVLVATEHMDHKTAISKLNVKFEQWPSELIPDGAITSGKIPVGKVVVTRLRKGQAVIAEDVWEKEDLPVFKIPPGYSVVNVKYPLHAFGGLLCPGDIVDVVLADDFGGSGQERDAVLKSVRVFNIGQSGLPPDYRPIVGLLLTEKQSKAIAVARDADMIDLRLTFD